MNTTTTIQGIEVLASTHGSSTSLFVSSKEMAKVARGMLKQMKQKGSVKKSSTGSLYITLPEGTTPETKERVRSALRVLEGESFDGMYDLAETIDRTDDKGVRCYFGSKYVFVEVKR